MHVQYLGRLAELLHQYTPLPRSNILTDDVWPLMAVQLSSLSNKQTLSKQGHQRVTRPVFLTNGRHLFKDVFVFHFQYGSCMNVTFDGDGIARWMGWICPVADIALFEKRKPQDPWFPRLKLVGVYPVMCSWAYIDPEDLAGMGEEYDSPLYIVPGSAWLKRLGLGLEHRYRVSRLWKPHQKRAKGKNTDTKHVQAGSGSELSRDDIMHQLVAIRTELSELIERLDCIP